MLDNCNVEEKNLLCKVQKEQFLEVLSNNTQNITLNFYDYEILQTKFDSVLDITINNKIEQKEDVYIELTAIKQNYINWMNLIIYETNVSSISNVFSDIFYLDFYWKPNTRLDKQRCFLKKIPEQPLLLFCLISFEQKINIFLNETEQYFNNISIKYNFILLPMQNILYFNVLNYGCHIFYEYPPILNFYDKEEFIIYFHIEGNDKTNDIKLHPESNNLKCELKYFPGNIIKACDITINDFKGKNSSYYNIYYQNYTKNYSLLYNLSPIKVLLPKENELFFRIKKENNKNILEIGQKGTIAFITSYNDKKNIFSDIDIEKYITFNSKIIDKNKNEYNVNCKIWKPKDENISIICNLNEILPNYRNYIILNDTIIVYNGFIIYIKQEDYIEVEKNYYNVSFLYYDKQIIDIEDDKDSYELKFKFESYNNDMLYIWTIK